MLVIMPPKPLVKLVLCVSLVPIGVLLSMDGLCLYGFDVLNELSEGSVVCVGAMMSLSVSVAGSVVASGSVGVVGAVDGCAVCRFCTHACMSAAALCFIALSFFAFLPCSISLFC